MPTPVDALERLAEAHALAAPPPTRRMLVVVNPYASTTSDRLRHLVVYALQGRYDVQAVDTSHPGHATELARDAARDGVDVVVAFGGDGTVNEVANGLAGSSVALTCLPGGATNVFCRMLGIPTDVVDATEHLLHLADGWAPRRVDLAALNGRHFCFSAGVGLDASVVRRVDQHPHLKSRLGAWYFTAAAISTFSRRYLRNPPELEAILGEERVRGVSAMVQNGTPYTYFLERAVALTDGAGLGTGTLAGVVLQRARARDMPTLAWRALGPGRPAARHRRVHGFAGLSELTVASLDERPLPLQVDGDYVGEEREARFSVTPAGLAVVG